MFKPIWNHESVGSQGGIFMSRYLKNKECAEWLYDLYKKYFNRMYDLSVSPEQRKKYNDYSITEKEIAIYENHILFISDESLIYVFEKAREWSVSKFTFLLKVAMPIYEMVKGKNPKNNDELYEFIIEIGIGKGVFSNCSQLKKWFQEEKLTQKEAEKIVNNIEDFFACYS